MDTFFNVIKANKALSVIAFIFIVGGVSTSAHAVNCVGFYELMVDRNSYYYH